jgi:hypothetical protein
MNSLFFFETGLLVFTQIQMKWRDGVSDSFRNIKIRSRNIVRHSRIGGPCPRNQRGDKTLCIPKTKAAAANVPMKKVSELFTDEEKKQLSYLGSMLSRPNTPFEEEVQRILDAEDSEAEGRRDRASRSRKKIPRAKV